MPYLAELRHPHARSQDDQRDLLPIAKQLYAARRLRPIFAKVQHF